MAEQQNKGGDAIDKAMARNGVRPGSELERDTRQSIYSIVGTDMSDADAKLDKFVAERRGDPYYSTSFEQPQPQSQHQGKPKIDQHNLLTLTPEEFQDVVSGKVAVGK